TADIHYWEIVLLAHVGNVERPMLTYPEKPRVPYINLGAVNRYGYGSKMSPHNHSVSLAESQRYIINSTNPRRALCDGIENRLHVGRRTADNGENLCCCRLVLQGLAQFCIALLKLFEQPHVLDGDHCLICESLEQLYLLVREWANFHATDRNRSNRGIL